MKNPIKTYSLFLLVGMLTACGANSAWRDNAAKTQADQITIGRDVAYGQHAKQKLDIYSPLQPNSSPIIVMVHGGAWRMGDKANRDVFQHKVTRWVGQGTIFISVNYRLLPEANAYTQIQDIAKAMQFIQKNAVNWGGNPSQLILMGHSAGGHLVSMLSSQPSLVTNLGGTTWLGTVSLDSAALNIPDIMQAEHAKFYDDAFGKKAALWSDASPYHQLSQRSLPLLLVCSIERKQDSCGAAKQYAAPAHLKHAKAELLLRRSASPACWCARAISCTPTATAR